MTCSQGVWLLSLLAKCKTCVSSKKNKASGEAAVNQLPSKSRAEKQKRVALETLRNLCGRVVGRAGRAFASLLNVSL